MQSPRTARTWHSVGTTRSRQLQWTQKIAEIVKNPLGFLATQEGPLAVVLFFLKVLYFFRPPNLS